MVNILVTIVVILSKSCSIPCDLFAIYHSFPECMSDRGVVAFCFVLHLEINQARA